MLVHSDTGSFVSARFCYSYLVSVCYLLWKMRKETREFKLNLQNSSAIEALKRGEHTNHTQNYLLGLVMAIRVFDSDDLECSSGLLSRCRH